MRRGRVFPEHPREGNGLDNRSREGAMNCYVNQSSFRGHIELKRSSFIWEVIPQWDEVGGSEQDAPQRQR